MDSNNLNIRNDNVDFGFQQQTLTDQYNYDNPCSYTSNNCNTHFDLPDDNKLFKNNNKTSQCFPSSIDSSYTTQYVNHNENTVQYPSTHTQYNGQTSPIPTPKQQYTYNNDISTQQVSNQNSQQSTNNLLNINSSNSQQSTNNLLNMNSPNSQQSTNNLLNINSSNSQQSTNDLLNANSSNSQQFTNNLLNINSSNMSFNNQQNYIELIKMEILGIEIIFRQKYLPNLNQCCKRCQHQQTPVITNHTGKFQGHNYHIPIEQNFGQNNNAAVNRFCSSSDKSSVELSPNNIQNICNNQNFFRDKSQS